MDHAPPPRAAPAHVRSAAAAAEATWGVVASSAVVSLPRVIVDAGPVAVGKFVEFFAGRIANERTRAAYARVAGQFLAWCEARGLRLEAVSPVHVAAYIRTHPGSAPTVQQHLAAIRMLCGPRRPPTVKQHLAAIRMLCDWLVVSKVLPVNPAAAVRGAEARRHEGRDGGPLVSGDRNLANALTPARRRQLPPEVERPVGNIADPWCSLNHNQQAPFIISTSPNCLRSSRRVIQIGPRRTVVDRAACWLSSDGTVEPRDAVSP